MNIIKKTFNFKPLINRKQTKYIILHHRAGNGDVESIHNQHLKQGFSGIGYHFYIRKNGEIYSGRPIEKTGAHCIDYNDVSIGVCFEGNFETEKMGDIQLRAGKELISYLKNLFPKADLKMHKELYPTACPGRNFPFDKIKQGAANPMKKLEKPNDIIWELMNGNLKIEINDVNGAVFALENAKNYNSPLYWILYKIVNKER